MKAQIIKFTPPPPPSLVEVTLAMSEDEAARLKYLLGQTTAIERGFKSSPYRSYAKNIAGLMATVQAAYEALDNAGVRLASIDEFKR